MVRPMTSRRPTEETLSLGTVSEGSRHAGNVRHGYISTLHT